MEIDNKYNVGQTYYRFREGIIEEVLITRLLCIISIESGTSYKYCGRYSGRAFDNKDESELNLFESKEECRKYAISTILDQ